MSGFIRDDAKAQLMRWREVLAGGAAVLLGGWLMTKSGFLLMFPGFVLLVGGAAMVWIGVQRARFRSTGSGPGSVQVDEGQVTYYGPLTGGAVALREIGSLVYDPTLHPAHWRMMQRGNAELLIPVNAEGAEALFDAFATLPGLSMNDVLQAMKGQSGQPVVIWKRNLSFSAQRSLH